MRKPTKKLDYIRELYAPEDNVLREIRQTLSEQKLEWQMGAEECKLLQLLIKLHGAKRIIEIGTLAGYSAIWMARALPTDGHLWTCEKNPEHAAMARDFIARTEVADRITILEGDAHEQLETLATSEHELFDMMVIDGEKSGYNRYLDWAEQHIRSGGLIIADNTLLFDTVYEATPPEKPGKSSWEGMKRFNQRLADSKQFESVMIATADGLSVAVKK